MEGSVREQSKDQEISPNVESERSTEVGESGESDLSEFVENNINEVRERGSEAIEYIDNFSDTVEVEGLAMNKNGELILDPNKFREAVERREEKAIKEVQEAEDSAVSEMKEAAKNQEGDAVGSNEGEDIPKISQDELEPVEDNKEPEELPDGAIESIAEVGKGNKPEEISQDELEEVPDTDGGDELEEISAEEVKPIPEKPEELNVEGIGSLQYKAKIGSGGFKEVYSYSIEDKDSKEEYAVGFLKERTEASLNSLRREKKAAEAFSDIENVVNTKGIYILKEDGETIEYSPGKFEEGDEVIIIQEKLEGEEMGKQVENVREKYYSEEEKNAIMIEVNNEFKGKNVSELEENMEKYPHLDSDVIYNSAENRIEQHEKNEEELMEEENVDTREKLRSVFYEKELRNELKAIRQRELVNERIDSNEERDRREFNEKQDEMLDNMESIIDVFIEIADRGYAYNDPKLEQILGGKLTDLGTVDRVDDEDFNMISGSPGRNIEEGIFSNEGVSKYKKMLFDGELKQASDRKNLTREFFKGICSSFRSKDLPPVAGTKKRGIKEAYYDIAKGEEAEYNFKSKEDLQKMSLAYLNNQLEVPPLVLAAITPSSDPEELIDHVPDLDSIWENGSEIEGFDMIKNKDSGLRDWVEDLRDDPEKIGKLREFLSIMNREDKLRRFFASKGEGADETYRELGEEILKFSKEHNNQQNNN